MDESQIPAFLKVIGTSVVSVVAGIFLAGVLFAKKVAKLDAIEEGLKSNTENDKVRQAQVDDLKERMLATEIHSKNRAEAFKAMKTEFESLRNDLRDWMAKK